MFRPNLSSDRSFGIVFGLLAGWAAWSLCKKSDVAGAALAVVSAALLGTAFVHPLLLNPLKRGWLKLGLLISKVTNPVFLGAIFFVLITPVALCMRLFGRDALQMRRQSVPSYWKDKRISAEDPDYFKHPF